jgi:cytochrome c biogenesis protein
MTVTPAGLETRARSQWTDGLVELLASMRFAIALLSVICIASVIGTVLKQHEPYNNYVNQFGPFWAEVFARFDLYSVYSAWWFLLILAFLVVSTSLCIARNTPKIVADLKAYKETIRVQSLQAFAHRATGALSGDAEFEAQRLSNGLVLDGWTVKLQARSLPSGGRGWMVAAKRGAANKLGYLAAHSAIVLICVGGLLDGDLIVRAQMWLNDKSVYPGGGLIADVPERHRLSPQNPTFRGNLLVAEGGKASTAILAQPTGVLLQDLPFSVELKKFIVDYYSTGMPKLFASEIVIHDHATGETVPARVEVNHPAKYKGIEIFQASFDDGGSKVRLKVMPLEGGKPFTMDGVIGGSTTLTQAGEDLTVEFTALRVINVENFGPELGQGTAAGDASLMHAIETRLGAAHKTPTEKVLRNIGPSITYKLRDAAGQAVEFSNYMLPVELDGQQTFLLGLRETPTEPLRYLRIPADDQGRLDGWLRLRQALMDPGLRQQAARRYALDAVEGQRPDLVQALQASAERALGLFAGAEAVAANARPSKADGGGEVQASRGGLQAVSRFMETNVPEADREKASDVLVRILNGSLFELNQLARARDGLPPMVRDDAARAFMTQSVVSLSDAFFYRAPVIMMLDDFQQVQASVFQVSRAPGKTVVYIGCFFLIVGIFAMFYIRERRLWIWVEPVESGAQTGASHRSHATMAMSCNRKTLEVDEEFAQLRQRWLVQS